MTKNIAHRGFSGKYPENTMLAFEKAVEAGCDGIELDIQLTKDGEIVIIHDESTKRTANRPGLVRDRTLEELRRLDASNGYGAEYGFNPVPTLREYFEYIRDKDVFTNIELKNSLFRYRGMEEKMIALIREYDLTEKVLFSSFNHFSMLKCKRLSPESRCALLTSSWLAGAGAYAQRLGAEFINPFYPFLTDQNIRELRGHGIRAQAWTVNDTRAMRRLARRGVFGVITNRPDIFRKIRDGLAG